MRVRSQSKSRKGTSAVEMAIIAPVFVTLVSWRDGMRGSSGLIGSVPAVEKELIALCSEGSCLLNVDGR